MMDYEKLSCFCGEQARIVVSGVGTYIHCPFCQRYIYMCSTKEDAIRKFKEKYDGTDN